jgi:hypothetical protein
VHVVAYWLRHYATNRKIVCSKPHEVNEFFPIYLIFPGPLGPGVYSTSIINEYQKQKMLTTLPLSVSQLSRQCGILNISQTYNPARPVTAIALL